MIRDIKLDALQQEHISHVLKEWHRWSSCDRVGTGYPGTAAGCSMYRASRQHDLENGALDIEADNETSRAVDRIIGKMEQHYRIALSFEARNLCGARVWRTPRIEAEAIEVVTQDARQLLWQGLVKDGLV